MQPAQINIISLIASRRGSQVERKRIVEAVNKDIAAAGSAAQRDLKRFAAGLSVDRAAQRISLTEDDDRALMQEFAQSLGRETRSGGQS